MCVFLFAEVYVEYQGAMVACVTAPDEHVARNMLVRQYTKKAHADWGGDIGNASRAIRAFRDALAKQTPQSWEASESHCVIHESLFGY